MSGSGDEVKQEENEDRVLGRGRGGPLDPAIDTFEDKVSELTSSTSAPSSSSSGPNTLPQLDTRLPSTVLVCDECAVYYEAEGGWEYCPRCSEELTEVTKA
jgi:hypothetical protein